VTITFLFIKTSVYILCVCSVEFALYAFYVYSKLETNSNHILLTIHQQSSLLVV